MHVQKYKDGKGKDKLFKCKKDAALMFFDKEEHSKKCKKFNELFFEKKIDETKDTTIIPNYKNYEKADSVSIITGTFGKSIDNSFNCDLGSFISSDISAVVNDRSILSNMKTNRRKKEISVFDISAISRKI